MDATHPIIVVLFWDSEHERYVYDPYFTGTTKKKWTFTLMVAHDQLVRKIFKHRGTDPNQWHAFLDVQHTQVSTQKDHTNVHQHVTTITQMISDEPSIFYPDVEEDDEDDDDADADYDVSSVSDLDNGDNDEEDDISTPLNPLSSTTVNQ
ncbi:hypothetical protein M9H77_25620 [Catharanthus roseus]|uniref:Uncharacterized protein n=1 Tax=Catharanthus roseus TaxID=4058 RepID=A0ACC0A8P8_CATRO|nr:hypothetical protein M9H77_25620 [Catharanthus roseus]